MDPLLPFLSALLLGSLHAFEADHVAAVSTFVLRRPRPLAAVGFGVRWAVGHGAVLVILGAVVVVLGLHLPERSGHGLERGVGASLVALGLWTALGARALHAHRHTHADGTTHVHLHSHLFRPDHRHGHAATAVGALHGLAGTAPAVALLPLARFDSGWIAVGCLILFATGTALAMALYAMFAGWIAGRAALHSERLARALALVTGAATAAVGLLWMTR